ncbi:hypothetical protein GCM10009784_09980 [Arthrobacter parietis]|uniref:PrsW family intramembrane metalloprotease n=1 Tax=Arthrobacter parietis TaxID=271434 RepID=A0ABP5MGY2_9MICC
MCKLTAVVPPEVAAEALVVGAMMVAQIRETDFRNFSIALPAFLTFVTMPLTHSIANGIGAGFISWVIIRASSGKAARSIRSSGWWQPGSSSTSLAAQSRYGWAGDRPLGSMLTREADLSGRDLVLAGPGGTVPLRNGAGGAVR